MIVLLCLLLLYAFSWISLPILAKGVFAPGFTMGVLIGPLLRYWIEDRNTTCLIRSEGLDVSVRAQLQRRVLWSEVVSIRNRPYQVTLILMESPKKVKLRWLLRPDASCLEEFVRSNTSVNGAT